MTRKLCAKVVINVRYGGFGLSDAAIELLRSKHGVAYDSMNVTRNLVALVDVVEALGGKANGEYADLAVVPLKRGAKYVICEYDGMEWVAESHRVYDMKTKKWRLPSGQHNCTIVRTPPK